ncbi:MAG: VOC family protein [Streptosporangiales bacterium]|nr:VOC family protein [Streptosporangiales bacterium]
MSTAQPIPTGYPRVMPHLSIEGAAGALEFYKGVLGATERMRMALPDGTVAHAEIQLGESVIMIGDANLPTDTDPSPQALGGSPVALFVYLEDVDKAYERAIEEGAASVSKPADHFYGDRVATIDDPYGHRWNLATHVEDVPPDEMDHRAAAAMSGGEEA